MDATSPAEGELEYTSGDDAVTEENGDKEVHPLAAFLALHGITTDDDDDADDEDYVETGHELGRASVRCSNCTSLNLQSEEFCGLCNELLESHILELPSFGGPSEATDADVVEDAKSTAEKQHSSAGLLSKNLVFSGTFMSGERRKTALGYDARMLDHEETGKVHPERPDRLRAIMGGLRASGLLSAQTFFVSPREATLAELELVHSADHIGRVQAPVEDLFYFTNDTYVNKHSALAASLAAGICIDLASAIMKGKAHNGFAIVRPPGHHAEAEIAQGFCLHNNAGVAAKAAQAAGAKKVLIVDWDVHHGNGTQQIFEQDPSTLYISLHRYQNGKFYPGTGGVEQVGSGAGVGFCVNIPWECSMVGDADYLSAFEHLVMPIARQFGPDMTIISAGFDAARGDPLGGCDVTPQGYAQMTHLLSSLAAGRMLVVLEGGYNLRSISESANAVVEVLQGANPGPLPDGLQTSLHAATMFLEVVKIQGPHWSCLNDDTVLRLTALKDNAIKGMGERKSPKRRHTGGPVWWKWGRKRLLYDIWLKGQMKHHPPSRHDDSCAYC